MLLRSSKLLQKLATAAAAQNALTTVEDVRQQSPKNGLQGRLTRGAAQGSSVKKMQAPRAYAPRVSKII